MVFHPSQRRNSTTKKIGLTLAALCAPILVLVFLFAIVRETTATESPTLQSPSDSTAVLFLIDESGGVSGMCGDTSPDQVLVTDAEGTRYDIARFSLALWRAYYSKKWEFTQGFSERLLPFYLGISQFAQGYASTLPLTQITPTVDMASSWDIFNVPSIRQSYDKLLSRDKMLAGFPKNWFCATNYFEALERAAQDLKQIDAPQRILVLLTDGSFRGSELNQSNDIIRSQARRETERGLQLLAGNGIQVHVLLLGRDLCATSGCSLSDREKGLREDDFRAWDAWAKQQYITLLDSQQPFQSIGEIRSVAALLPGVNRRGTSGWVDSRSGGPLSLRLRGQVEKARIVVVTSKDVNVDALHVSENDMTIYGRKVREQWLEYDKDVSNPQSDEPCPSRAWALEMSQRDLVAYYWLVPDWTFPISTTVSIVPDSVILNHDPHLTVTVQVSGTTGYPQYPGCYQITAMAGDQKASRLLNAKDKPTSLIFTLPMSLAWGTIPVSVNIAYADWPETTWGETRGDVSVKYEPRVLTTQISLSPSVAWEELEKAGTGSVTVTVPISWANRVPGFSPSFGLYPSRPNPEKCASVLNAEILAQTVTPDKSGNPWSYEIVYPYQDVLEARCDFKFMRIYWPMPDGTSREVSYTLEVRPTPTLTPTLSLTPTPSATPQPGGLIEDIKKIISNNPFIVAIVAIVVLILVMCALWLSRTKKVK